MASDEKINLTVQVNAETGQLEVLGAKFDAVGAQAKKAEGTFQGLSGEAGNLLKSFLPFATAGGIIAFFAGAIKGAEEQNEAMRRLQFTVESLNGSWEKSRQNVADWAAGIQAATRFSDSDALQSLEKLARATGDVAQGQKASKLAMDLSVSTGQNLASTTELVNSLINGQARSVLQATKEFGSFTNGATTAQGVLDALGQHVSGAAEKEESLTKTQAQTSHAFEDFSKQIGQTFMPAVTAIVSSLTGLIKIVDNIGSAVAGAAAVVFHTIQGLASANVAVITGHWGQLKQISQQTMAEIASDVTASTSDIVRTWSGGEEAKTQAVLNGTNDRLSINHAAAAKIAADKEASDLDTLQKAREQASKIANIEHELQAKMAALPNQTLQVKLAAFNAEVVANRAKINAEIKDENAKQVLLKQLSDYEVKQTQVITNQEYMIKAQAAFNIANLAVETLQTVNSMSEKGSEAERVRAKALLALQQSIAIGWAWVNAMKVGGPLAVGLAAATTGLIVAQFAQQSQNIDKASHAESAGIGSLKIDAPVPGIDTGAISPGGGLPSGGSGGGGSFVSSGGGGGGGGGGGQTVINVGGIVVNFNPENLSIDNVDVVMMRMYEKVRQGTIEGVQLAVAFQNQATKNSNLAV
jgi:hypothetical protein